MFIGPLRPPFFTYRPQSITVLTGGMAKLYCGGGGNPVPSVIWKRLLFSPNLVYSGTMEDVQLDSRVSTTLDNFLFLTDVKLQDEGFYFCVLNSTLGEQISNFALLNVYSQSSYFNHYEILLSLCGYVVVLVFPTVTVPFSILEVELAATLTLQCDGQGDPLPDIRWLLLPTMALLPSEDFPNIVYKQSRLPLPHIHCLTVYSLDY